MGVMIRMSLDEMVMREKLIKNVTAYVGKEFDRRDGVDVYIVEDRIKHVVDLMNAGINVCLGSDAAINNNSNEVRGEVSAAFNKISDKYGKANMIDHRELFRMLTLNGAKAMGLENEIGTIEEGKNADLVLWSKNDTPFIPGFNYLADLIFTEGGNAHTVLINGDIVLQNYKSVKVDEIELVKKARKVSDRYHKAFNDEVAGHLR